MTKQYVIVLLSDDRVIGPFGSEDAALSFAKVSDFSMYIVRALELPEFS